MVVKIGWHHAFIVVACAFVGFVFLTMQDRAQMQDRLASLQAQYTEDIETCATELAVRMLLEQSCM